MEYGEYIYVPYSRVKRYQGNTYIIHVGYMYSIWNIHVLYIVRNTDGLDDQKKARWPTRDCSQKITNSKQLPNILLQLSITTSYSLTMA